MDKVPRTILITGTTGLVGNYIYNSFKSLNVGNIIGTSRSGSSSVDYQIDLTNPDKVKELARRVHADVVIHTAAISKTDICQENRERCYEANVESTNNLILAYPQAKFVYFSTYAVYNTSEGKCQESAPVSSTNYYIETKLLGEKHILSTKFPLIFRPSVIFGFLKYSRDSKNYFMQLVENIRLKKTTRSPIDQYFNPVLVNVVSEIVRQGIEKDINGIYNIGSNEDISKYEFNRMLMHKFSFDDTYLEGINSNTLAVSRPNNGTISSDLIQKTLGYRIPGLCDMIEQLYESTSGYPLI